MNTWKEPKNKSKESAGSVYRTQRKDPEIPDRFESSVWE